MERVVHEVTQAFQRLRRSPGFTLPAILTLTLGIGACVLMLNIISGVLLSPLPFKESARVAMVWGYYPDYNLGYPEQPIAGLFFTTIRDNTNAFTAVAAFRARALNLGDVATPERPRRRCRRPGEFFRRDRGLRRDRESLFATERNARARPCRRDLGRTLAKAVWR